MFFARDLHGNFDQSLFRHLIIGFDVLDPQSLRVPAVKKKRLREKKADGLTLNANDERPTELQVVLECLSSPTNFPRAKFALGLVGNLSAKTCFRIIVNFVEVSGAENLKNQ